MKLIDFITAMEARRILFVPVLIQKTHWMNEQQIAAN
jgi:hypothetical protein